jgi:hypothetical protein
MVCVLLKRERERDVKEETKQKQGKKQLTQYQFDHKQR